jgi:predicted nucleic-acid-binding protein
VTKYRLIDTNLIVRYLVQDQPKHAQVAQKLFEACDRGELSVVILPAVLAECVFVLDSFYRRSRASIAEVLGTLLASAGVEIADLAVHLDALQRYRNSRLHFVDCLLAAAAAAKNIPVASFDRGFRAFSDVRVELG